jgi:hypothetical protein
MGGFKRRNRLFARDRWKCVEKFVEAMVSLKIVDQISKWHTCANEHRRATKDAGSL